MIKREIRSQIKNLLPTDKVGKYQDRVLDSVIERVLVAMYREIAQSNPRLLGNYTRMYGVPTAIAISQEATSGTYYSTLPVPIVDIPRKGSGVIGIYTVANTGNVFQPMDATEADLIFNTDCAIVTNKIGYLTRQDTRVDYWNTNAVVRAAGVRMALLVKFSSYGDTEVVHIPELTSEKGGSFIERVLNILGVIPPVDLLDNNYDSQTKSSK